MGGAAVHPADGSRGLQRVARVDLSCRDRCDVLADRQLDDGRASGAGSLEHLFSERHVLDAGPGRDALALELGDGLEGACLRHHELIEHVLEVARVGGEYLEGAGLRELADGEIGGAGIETGGFGGDDDALLGFADGKAKVNLLGLSRSEDDIDAGLGLEASAGDGKTVGAGVERGEVVRARGVGGGLADEPGGGLGGGDLGGGDAGSGVVGDLAVDGAEVALGGGGGTPARSGGRGDAAGGVV